MRLLLYGTLSLLFLLPTNAQPKPAWEWSSEERIAARVDPARVRERLDRHHTQQKSSPGRQVVSSAVTDAAKFVINGSVNPELFMPWELVERLMNSTDPASAAAEMLRRRYADDVVASGWSTATFWSEFDAIAAEFRDVRAQLTTDEAHQRYCRARAEVLRKARHKFGAKEFDRFLYEAVAPTVVVYADEPMTAEQLLSIERGCR